MAETELQRRIGTILRGKWTLERLLGSGGMGAVYLGLHKIGRRDAIKILHPEIARMPELCARFEQEALAVNRFVHPGAVEIRDADTSEDGCPFLVMELLEGESLADRAARLGRLDTSEILDLIEGLLDVLAAAHAHGIIHRDIKPANLFCLRDGRLKVLDFGVARVRQAAAASFHTRTGTTLGTVAYMPPEQVRGGDIDARVDLFAVGATMFRLIAKRRIHEAGSDAELVLKMATLPAPSLASVAPDTPPAVCAIVDRALAFERDQRYPSATAMQQDIRAVRAGQPAAFAPHLVGAAHRVVVGASTHGSGSIGTAMTVAAPHAVTAWAGRAPAPPPAAPARAPGNDPPHPALSKAGGSVVAPATGLSASTPALTKATQWTVTTVRGRRMRWAALAFPLLGAGVLAVVYYQAVHVEPDAPPPASSRGLKSPASPPARSPAARTSAATAAPSPAAKDGERPRPPSEPTRDRGEEANLPQRTSCMLTSSCDYVCDDACELGCTNRGGCDFGARRDALVECKGPAPCKISCEGDCVANCGAPCLLQCTPGSRCVIGECPQQIETCAADVLACGVRCPD